MSAKPVILLVNPHIEDFAAYDHFSKPLGLITLASYLEEHYQVRFVNALDRLHPSNHNVKFRPDGTGDFNRKFIDKPPVLKDIPRRFKRYGLDDSVFMEAISSLEREPEFVFVTSGMTYWYTGLRHTIGLIRQVYPGTKIVLGGIYASLLPGHAVQNSGADLVIPHQDINRCLDALEPVTGKTFQREFRDPCHGLLGEYYYLPVMTSSGCVYRCSYCASSWLGKYISHPPEKTADMILRLNREHGVTRFAFYDDALLYRAEEHLHVILKKIISGGVRLEFHTPNGLHIRFLKKETALLMKEAGFKDLRFSLESCDPVFLENSGNKTALDEFDNCMETLRDAGFGRDQIRVYTLLNVPGQDDRSVEKTMRYIHDRGGLPMLAFYSPIPHTPDFEKANRVTDVTEPLFQNNNVYLFRSGFDMEYLHRLKRIEQAYRKSPQTGIFG